MSGFDKIFFVGGHCDMLSAGGGFSGSADGQDVWQPAADLMEVEGGFLIHIDLPGVDAASIEAVVDGRRLLVRGVRRAAFRGRCKRYIHMEVSRGEFGKVIELPEPVSADNASAVLQGGVLEISLPFGRRSVFEITMSEA